MAPTTTLLGSPPGPGRRQAVPRTRDEGEAKNGNENGQTRFPKKRRGRVCGCGCGWGGSLRFVRCPLCAHDGCKPTLPRIPAITFNGAPRCLCQTRVENVMMWLTPEDQQWSRANTKILGPSAPRLMQKVISSRGGVGNEGFSKKK